MLRRGRVYELRRCDKEGRRSGSMGEKSPTESIAADPWTCHGDEEMSLRPAYTTTAPAGVCLSLHTVAASSPAAITFAVPVHSLPQDHDHIPNLFVTIPFHSLHPSCRPNTSRESARGEHAMIPLTFLRHRLLPRGALRPPSPHTALYYPL